MRSERRSEVRERSEAAHGRLCIIGIRMGRSRRTDTQKRHESPRERLNACVLHVFAETQLPTNAFCSWQTCHGAPMSMCRKNTALVPKAGAASWLASASALRRTSMMPKRASRYAEVLVPSFPCLPRNKSTWGGRIRGEVNLGEFVD